VSGIDDEEEEAFTSVFEEQATSSITPEPVADEFVSFVDD
jgi:hypothetical protein